jgi:hypothetical protein
MGTTEGLKSIYDRVRRMKYLEAEEAGLIAEILNLEVDKSRMETKIEALTIKLKKVGDEIDNLRGK